MSDRILVATRKGTFLVDKLSGGWTPRLSGHPGALVNFVARDPHSGALWAALGHGHWGAKLSRSTDGGKTWNDATQIKYPRGRPLPRHRDADRGFPGARQADAARCHAAEALVHRFRGARAHLRGHDPGRPLRQQRRRRDLRAQPPALEPRVARRRPVRDGGQRRHALDGHAGFRAGEFAPGIHSILVDPRNHDRVLVAVSTAGVLETHDGGKSWRGRNKGLLNDYLPNPEAEWGHDPHAIELCPGQPDHVWQQNHCGVFYSTDGAATWKKVSQPERGVHFGFPVAVDERDGNTAWVVPGKSDQQRMAIDGGLFVGRTQDGGQTWEQLREGLPQENAYDVVLRHALGISGDRLAFGSTTGNLYVSEDRGESWTTVANNLPPIYTVRFA